MKILQKIAMIIKMTSLTEIKEDFLLKVENDQILGSYLSVIEEAVSFGEKKHNTQVSKYKKEPYFIHCILVAFNLLFEDDRDKNLIIAGLLHDTVEDTDTTLDEINSIFGEKVELLVRGMTKVDSKFKEVWSREKYYNEGFFGRLIDAGKHDDRVWKIKLSDRYENMKNYILWASYDKIPDYTWESEQFLKFSKEFKISSPLVQKLSDQINEYKEFMKKNNIVYSI